MLTSGTPLLAQQPDFSPQEDVPPQVFALSIAFFVTCAVIAIGIPLARAYGRWLDRRGQVSSATSPETEQRLTRIEQAIEAVAIEVERVSEGQRYTNRSISEMRGLPAPDPGAGWPLPVRDPVGVDQKARGDCDATGRYSRPSHTASARRHSGRRVSGVCDADAADGDGRPAQGAERSRGAACAGTNCGS